MKPTIEGFASDVRKLLIPKIERTAAAANDS